VIASSASSVADDHVDVVRLLADSRDLPAFLGESEPE